jgi:hypothetical protein
MASAHRKVHHMDAARFDTLLRSLAAASSRRGLLTGLAGSLLAALAAPLGGNEAMAACGGGCGQCERCRNGRCRPKQNETPCGSNATRQCCDGRCCERGDICVRGKCVTGQGTCADGADTCLLGNAACNGVDDHECTCVQTASGATRCAENSRIGDCGECDSDEFCRETYGAKAFCADIGHGTCGCPPATPNWCMRPCPV